mmetsp:Transcript_27134/g.74407  ORF Transcript_27134/g.74407 Transcript_27134/m.74407 type:complete len:320 (-) Transcript_27134:153-1112(-)|eukprot:CAMPEP_0172373410 /NCGR_PEP_ID=MMETSP1060-20121228/51511_1 /TAXON_ID=37318 /ORGANISM="Pseudo-nitzschia pungens, Strain cf. cingulata" /LENGTH=319 /DNA_ID=CAMNT_0013099741 /DNA_START=140 /DNA_END=1099 /DNA_ORIENTATION=+
MTFPSSKHTRKPVDVDPKQLEEIRAIRLASNKKMVEKYHAQFPKVPTMTSQELVERWRKIDMLEDKRDDALKSEDENDGDRFNASEIGPLLLIDVRSREERSVSMISGGLAMDELETTRWINHYVHNVEGNYEPHSYAIPTIVFYCTIGYRSGQEAQRLMDELSGTFGIDVGKTVEVKNLDGILAYSFVEDAPPLMSSNKGTQCSSDSFMTRRIHSFGKDWSEAADPSYEVVYFQNKAKLGCHLLQTGLKSMYRCIQHIISKSIARVKETKIVSKTCVEPVSFVKRANEGPVPASTRRICATGFTANNATRPPSPPIDV